MQSELTRVKNQAKQLTVRLTELGIGISHSQALEGVAAIAGYKNWHTYAANVDKVGIELEAKSVKCSIQTTFGVSNSVPGFQDNGQFGSFIIGATGEGKTQYLNYLLMNTLKKGVPVLVIEHGDELHYSIKKYGGTVTKLGKNGVLPTVFDYGTEESRNSLQCGYSFENNHKFEVDRFPTVPKFSKSPIIFIDDAKSCFSQCPSLKAVVFDLIKKGASFYATGHTQASLEALNEFASSLNAGPSSSPLIIRLTISHCSTTVAIKRS